MSFGSLAEEAMFLLPPQEWPPDKADLASIDDAIITLQQIASMTERERASFQQAAQGLGPEVWTAPSGEAARGLLNRFMARVDHLAAGCSAMAEALRPLPYATAAYKAVRAAAASQAEQLWVEMALNAAVARMEVPGTAAGSATATDPQVMANNDELSAVARRVVAARDEWRMAQSQAMAALDRLTDAYPEDPLVTQTLQRFQVTINDGGDHRADRTVRDEVARFLLTLSPANADALTQRPIVVDVAANGGTACDAPGHVAKADAKGNCSALGVTSGGVFGGTREIHVGAAESLLGQPTVGGGEGVGVIEHEFGHVVQNSLSPAQDQRLRDLFLARERELYKGRIGSQPFLSDYSKTNPSEFFAEATRMYQNTPDQNGGIASEKPTRDYLRAKDPELYAFLKSIYGNG